MGRLTLSSLTASGLLGLAAITNIAGSSTAIAQGDMNRTQIEKIVREYLTENPEIVIEAFQNYQIKQREQQTLASEAAVRPFIRELISGQNGHVLGASVEDAEAVVVEFFDYHCGYCELAAEYVLEMADNTDDVRIVLQEWPSIHEKSEDIARASLAAQGEARFAEYHQALMDEPGVISTERARQLADRFGIPAIKIDAALSAGQAGQDVARKLDRSMEIANFVGITGSPTFFVASPNGSYVKMIYSFNPAAIEEAIEEAKAAS